MYLRYSALIQKQISKNILFSAISIPFSVLMFQVFTHTVKPQFKGTRDFF